MQVAIVFAALVCVASAGVVAPGYLAAPAISPIAYSSPLALGAHPVAYAHAPVAVAHAAPIAYAHHAPAVLAAPAFARTVVAGPTIIG